jgi:beta-galactosidase/beta-glucuronidase
MQYDLGLVTLPFNQFAIEYQLEIMKKFGVNGILDSHDPPLLEFFNFCNIIGFIVIGEGFHQYDIHKIK